MTFFSKKYPQIAIFNIFRMLNPNLRFIFDESQQLACSFHNKLDGIFSLVVAFSAHSNAIPTIFGILTNLREQAIR